MQKSYLALGCFWKPEETFRQINGVIETEVGYAGGNNGNTNYEEVCTGKTGHTETVKIIYDEKIISYEKLLEVFFAIHDPTQKNMQYPDIGTQYRSEIFYENEQQKKIAKKYKNLFNEKLDGKIETNISKIKNYCRAEEYHQKYIMKRNQ
jgi:peptide-methionine (S)-S-oxide reductase